jgi:hypothetical protein
MTKSQAVLEDPYFQRGLTFATVPRSVIEAISPLSTGFGAISPSCFG